MMDELKVLEELIGMKYTQGDGRQRRHVLPMDTWLRVNEVLDKAGTTRLMRAVQDGLWACVDFLLRCGAYVNACDKKGQKAIDYSLSGDRHEVTLLLLQWDSHIPARFPGGGLDQRLQRAMQQNGEVRHFIEVRNAFHHVLMHEPVERLKEILAPMLSSCDSPRHWVNSRGHSALYTAAENDMCDAWAFLRASGFMYATRDEEERVRAKECDDMFVDAIGNHFVELPGCHVQKILAKSKIYQVVDMDEVSCSREVNCMLSVIDRDELTSGLLTCLQDDPYLEIIFDFSSEDIQCMKPMGRLGNIWGLTDLPMNRIYVTAMENEEFDRSDIVGNLAHELAHKTMDVIFGNNGLPYGKEDEDLKKEYKSVVETILSVGRLKSCDKIICNACVNPGLVEYELIVRVPEMISKYNAAVDLEGVADYSGIDRLKEQAPELLEYYIDHVLARIRGFVQKNHTAGRYAKNTWLRVPSLLTDHYAKDITICGSISRPQFSRHNRLTLLRVSNVKLGISHLQSLLKEVTFVDWSRYWRQRELFVKSVRRNEIQKLVIIWDESKKPNLCKSRLMCNNELCIGTQLECVEHKVILLVPKKYSVTQNCIDYSWHDLSNLTQKWIREKKLHFAGRTMTLSEVLHGVSDISMMEDKVGLFESLLGPDELSVLINEDAVHIGRLLESTRKQREFELLRKHPECLIPRNLRIRRLEFNRGLIKRRPNDAFVIRNAKKDDIEGAGIIQVQLWNGKCMSDDVRCFLLSREPRSGCGNDVFWEIFEILREWNLFNGQNWHFVHFFSLENKKFVHNGSLNCRKGAFLQVIGFEQSCLSLLGCDGKQEGQNEVLIVADAPGSGKSVLANKTACQVRKRLRTAWVDVIELLFFQKQLKFWSHQNLEWVRDHAFDFLYDLVKMGDTLLERKLFNLFCHCGDKMILFFDGFDEVCPDYRETIIFLLKAIVDGSCVKVCLMTRPHEAQDLEDSLRTLAFEFVPFNYEEQMKFFNLEWNASLKSLPSEERVDKIEQMIKSMKASPRLKSKNGISSLIESLHLCKTTGSVLPTVDFREVAEELIEGGIGVGNIDFLENPLQAWMLASIIFEEGFSLGDCMSLLELYKRFVETKISLYNKEKDLSHGYVSGRAMGKLLGTSVNKLLMKLSAFYFLEEEQYELEEDEMHVMLRVGLVVQGKNANRFVHRTFGEYMFLLWLVNKCGKPKVSRVWLSRVLLEKKYEKVRQFIDDHLLMENEMLPDTSESKRKQKASILNHTAFSLEDLKVYLQKCLYMSILECHEGILQFIVNNSGDIIADIVFGKVDWDVRSLEYPVRHENRDWNAITFCGRCLQDKEALKYSRPEHPLFTEEEEIRGSMEKVYLSRHAELDYLIFLLKLLLLLEKCGLVKNIGELIRNEGLQWMGLDIEQLWIEDVGRVEYETLLEFIIRNRSELASVVKERLFDEHNEKMLNNAAVFSFDKVVMFLESIFSDVELEGLVVRNNIFLNCWTKVFQLCGLKEVRRMWRFLESKLMDKEERKKILKQKDGRARNAFFSACINWGNVDVLPYVWYLCRTEMNRQECLQYLHDSFRGSMDWNMLKTDRFLKCFMDIQADGFLLADEANHLLLTKGEFGQCFLLNFNGKYSPDTLFQFQQLLASEKLETKTILQNLRGLYFWLAQSCFGHDERLFTDNNFNSAIEQDFEIIQSSLECFPFVNPIRIDSNSLLQGVLDEYRSGIKCFRLKMFLVLLRNQIRLEDRFLRSEELLRRLKEDWPWTFREFPLFIFEQPEEVESKSFLIPYFFAVVVEFLPKADVIEILLHSQGFWGNSFYDAVVRRDLRSFYSYYDIARWAIGEDSLWAVHGVHTEVARISVCKALLASQAKYSSE